MKQFNFKKKMKGFAISSELIFLSTIVTAGLTVGMVNVRDAVVAEMSDVANAVGALDQSYAYMGITNSQGSSEIEGGGYTDETDTNAGDLGQWAFLDADDEATQTNDFEDAVDQGLDQSAAAGGI